jgi:hypothetical protein
MRGHGFIYGQCKLGAMLRRLPFFDNMAVLLQIILQSTTGGSRAHDVVLFKVWCHALDICFSRAAALYKEKITQMAERAHRKFGTDVSVVCCFNDVSSFCIDVGTEA